MRSLHTCSNNCQMHAASELHLLIFVRDMYICMYMCVYVDARSVVSVQVPALWWGGGGGTLLHSEIFSIREYGMYWYWLHLYIRRNTATSVMIPYLMFVTKCKIFILKVIAHSILSGIEIRIWGTYVMISYPRLVPVLCQASLGKNERAKFETTAFVAALSWWFSGNALHCVNCWTFFFFFFFFIFFFFYLILFFSFPLHLLFFLFLSFIPPPHCFFYQAFPLWVYKWVWPRTPLYFFYFWGQPYYYLNIIYTMLLTFLGIR